MSRVFIESFFPTIITKLRSICDSLLDFKYINKNSYNILSILLHNDDMTDGMDFCRSEITVTMSLHHSLDDNYFDELHTPTKISIRNPALCLFAIFGAIFGIYTSLLDDNLGLHLLLRRPQRNLTPVLYWSMAFLFFGFMNMAAIPLHCLLPMKSNTLDDITFHRIPLAKQYPYLWMMDTFCTGVFSTSLIAALYTSRTIINNYVTITSTVWNRCDQYLIFMFVCGCTATSRYLIYDSSIELELWYILPVLLAAASFAFELFRRMSHHLLLSQNRILFYYYLVALFWLFTGIFLDPLSCRWIVQMHNHKHQSNQIDLSWWWDFTRLPAIAFGACDLVFIGLYHHLRMFYTSTTNDASERKKYK